MATHDSDGLITKGVSQDKPTNWKTLLGTLNNRVLCEIFKDILLILNRFHF